MKRILMIVCLAATFLGFGMNADAKKKDIAFQMYSVRELIGNPEKFAQNHKEVLAKLTTESFMALLLKNTRQRLRLPVWKCSRAMSATT